MLRTLTGSFLLACALVVPGCSASSDGFGNGLGSTSAAAESTGSPTIIGSFETPSAGGEQPVIDAINEAKTSIRMIMFHLTNPAVVTALVAAAGRGVDIEMILDNGNLSDHTPTSITAPLAKAKIKVIPSSTGFRITHVKSLVIDKSKALVMSLNLTMDFATTRDYAVVTTDAGVIAEFLKVFAADVVNAENGTANTPSLSSPYLAWSPVNSESRLTDFVNSAKSTLVATSENLGDPDIQAAMIRAAKRGVQVRVISPLCDQNTNPFLDIPFLAQLAAGGVDARAMPTPPSSATPYMHAKMMVADGDSAFVGSVNFSAASTTDARELGIFFKDASAIAMISEAFEADWAHAIVPPAQSAINCTAITPTDAGAPVTPSEDAGSVGEQDAGAPAVDAATGNDAGAVGIDAALPQVDAGAPTVDAAPPGVDAAPACTGFASPTTAAACNGCGDHTCQANGCYGGYWCDTTTSECTSASKVTCDSQ